MMGVKARIFAPQKSVTLDELVPSDHFYRHLERSLDLHFVRDLVRDRYAALGRPSIDPIVFFKLHLVMFFEGIRSARQLELVGADRISVRWYLGYDLHQPLPDHSSLTRIRDRYGIAVFRQFFEVILGRCQEAGLLVGRALYADGTLVEANADRDKMVPRFAVEAYLQQLFGEHDAAPAQADAAAPDQAVSAEPAADAVAVSPAKALAKLERLRCRVRARQRKCPLQDRVIRGHFRITRRPPTDPQSAEPPPPPTPQAATACSPPADTLSVASATELRADLDPARRAELEAHNLQRHDWFAQNGSPDRSIRRWGYKRVSDFWVSTTDPDATLMRQHGQGVKLRYRTHYIVDGGPARLILGVLVTPADVMENTVFLDLLWRTCFRWKLRPRSVSGDTTYGTVEIIKAVEDAGIRAYMPLADHTPDRPQFGKQAFRYDPDADQYVCPQGAVLRRVSTLHEQRYSLYQAEAGDCSSCPLKAQCSKGQEGRTIRRSFDEEYVERVRGYHQTRDYQKTYEKRKIWVEPLFGEAQEWHGMKRFRLRGLAKVNCEAVLTATGQNLKRLLARLGWGRRPFPCGATGERLAACPQQAAGEGIPSGASGKAEALQGAR
jgi:transposase